MRLFNILLSIPLWIIKMCIKLVISFFTEFWRIVSNIFKGIVFLIMYGITYLITFATGATVIGLAGYAILVWGTVLIITIFKLPYANVEVFGSEKQKFIELVVQPGLCVLGIPLVIMTSKALLYIVDIYNGLLPTIWSNICLFTNQFRGTGKENYHYMSNEENAVYPQGDE